MNSETNIITPQLSAEIIKRMMVLAKPIATAAGANIKIMDPYAGIGRIAGAIHKYLSPDSLIDVAETNPDYLIYLKKVNGLRILSESDLTGMVHGYDLILTSLPASDVDEMDTIHTMFHCLKTNGRLIVAVYPVWLTGKKKKQLEFRKWIEDLDGSIEELAEFGSSDVLLVLDNLVRSCRVCGCTDNDCRQCITKTGSPCYWVEADLCSACVPAEETIAFIPIADPITVIGTPELSISNNSKPNDNMKNLTLQREPLLKVLKKIKEVVAPKPTLPVLENVLINVRLTDIEIVATDLIVTIKGEVPCTHEEKKPFSFLLPFDFFYKLVVLAQCASIEIFTDSKTAKIIGYHDEYDLEDLDKVKDFPELPEFKEDHEVKMNHDFIDWFNRSLDSVDEKSQRPAMSKVYLDIEASKVSVVSTNAKVLFLKSFETTGDFATGLLIHPKIVKALKGFPETEISWCPTHVSFRSENITLIGTLQDEQYVNYKAIIEQDATPNLVFNRKELIDALERVALAKDKPATFFLKQSIGYVVIETFDFELQRKITVQVPGDFAGECEKIGFLPQTMLTTLYQVDFEKVQMCITKPSTAVLVTSQEDESYRGLIIPYTLS